MAATMTKERVMEQAAGNAIAFLAGLVVLWLWRPPTSVPVLTALLVGLAVAVPIDVAIDWFVFKRNLREQFGLRPFRYSVPAVPAFLAATGALNALSASDRPDRAAIAFALCFGLLGAGVLVSNWWWAHATHTRADDIRAR
jgi:hypothetical protein